MNPTPKNPTAAAKCEHMIQPRRVYFPVPPHQCGRGGTVPYLGRFYCRTHARQLGILSPAIPEAARSNNPADPWIVRFFESDTGPRRLVGEFSTEAAARGAAARALGRLSLRGLSSWYNRDNDRITYSARHEDGRFVTIGHERNTP